MKLIAVVVGRVTAVYAVQGTPGLQSTIGQTPLNFQASDGLLCRWVPAAVAGDKWAGIFTQRAPAVKK